MKQPMQMQPLYCPSKRTSFFGANYVSLPSPCQDVCSEHFQEEKEEKIDDEFIWKFRPGFGDIDLYPEVNNGRHFVLLTLQDMI